VAALERRHAKIRKEPLKSDPRRLQSVNQPQPNLAIFLVGALSSSRTTQPKNLLAMLRLVCSVLVNSDSLTTNYGIKQSQFTKPTSEPHANDPEESNKAFECNITVANHQLIIVITFVAKNYTYP
jgi:hypothetical protein